MKLQDKANIAFSVGFMAEFQNSILGFEFFNSAFSIIDFYIKI